MRADVATVVDEFLRGKLTAAYAELTVAQQAKFEFLFRGTPEVIPLDRLETALGVCERTIKKNKNEAQP